MFKSIKKNKKNLKGSGVISLSNILQNVILVTAFYEKGKIKINRM